MELKRLNLIEEISKWWYSNTNEALLVFGMIGVGKTTLVKKWADDNIGKFSSYTFISETQYEDIKDIFADAKSESFDIPLKIVNKLLMDKPLEQLIVIDGIKPGDEILVQIKKLCSSSNHRFILISDYGDYVFDNLRFIPVGYLKKVKILPLSFKEFCNFQLNKGVFDALNIYIDKDEQTTLPFSKRISELWDEYLAFGGFPEIVSSLLTEGHIAANNRLLTLKLRIMEFVRNRLPLPKTLLTLLENYSIERSSAYNSFVFNKILQGTTHERFERALTILSKVGILYSLPIIGENLNFRYFDLYLCDPGLEKIWFENKYDRKHALQSVVFNFGINKGLSPYRLIINKRNLIELMWDDPFPTLFDIRLKLTYGLIISADKLNEFGVKHSNTYMPYILVDRGIDYRDTIERANVMPIWAYLLTN